MNTHDIHSLHACFFAGFIRDEISAHQSRQACSSRKKRSLGFVWHTVWLVLDETRSVAAWCVVGTGVAGGGSAWLVPSCHTHPLSYAIDAYFLRINPTSS